MARFLDSPHRDYASNGAVQVSLFADRLSVSNPGELPPPLTPERLRQPHGTIPRNHRVCEALFLARYIEKFGTLMMIRECTAQGLPEPQFEQRAGEFGTTIWRDWLTNATLASFGISDRQKAAIAFVKTHGRITNTQYQDLTGVAKRTAHRDMQELVSKGVFSRSGKTGNGTFYDLAKGATKGPKGQRRHHRSQPNPP